MYSGTDAVIEHPQYFCLKRLSRSLSLRLIRSLSPILHYLQRATSAPIAREEENSQSNILSQTIIAIFVLLTVSLVSEHLNKIPSWVVTSLLVSTNFALLLSAIFFRFSGRRNLSNRLFSWCTINYIFSSSALLLQLGVVDFIPQSFYFWALGGIILSFLGTSRAPLLLTQVSILAWMYSQFLYGYSLLHSIPAIALCATVIARTPAWRDQFSILMFNIVILVNFVGYDFLNEQHFPLQLSRDHICWTLAAFLLLAALGVFLQCIGDKRYYDLGKTGLLISFLLFTIVLLALSISTTWSALFSLTMQQPAWTYSLLTTTIIVAFSICLFAQGKTNGQGILALIYLTVVSTYLIHSICQGITVATSPPALMLSFSGIFCCYWGVILHSNLSMVAGVTLIVSPIFTKYIVLGTSYSTGELLFSAACFALALLLSKYTEKRMAYSNAP